MKALALMMMAASVTATANTHDHAGHGAHEHGHGQLNLVQDGDQLMLELTAPAADLIGFEHAPKNAEEKAKLEQALAQLKRPDQLFGLAQAAGCTLASLDVKAEHDEDEHHDDADEHKHHDDADEHKHHDDADEHEHHDDADEHEHHDDADEHEHHDHADVAATYTFTCQQAAELKGIEVRLFTHYPSLEKLTVQGLIPGGQVAGELTPANYRLGW